MFLRYHCLATNVGVSIYRTYNTFQMRFRFVGDLDCPDWILSEIAELSHFKLDEFDKLCREVVYRLLSGNFDWESTDLTQRSSTVHESRLRGAIAAIGFIVEKAAKHRCQPVDLEKEMSQLGMESGYVRPLIDIYTESYERLTDSLTANFIREPCLLITDHRTESVGSAKVHVISGKTRDKSYHLAVADDQLQLMKSELNRALDSLECFIK